MQVYTYTVSTHCDCTMTRVVGLRDQDVHFTEADQYAAFTADPSDSWLQEFVSARASACLLQISSVLSAVREHSHLRNELVAIHKLSLPPSVWAMSTDETPPRLYAGTDDQHLAMADRAKLIELPSAHLPDPDDLQPIRAPELAWLWYEQKGLNSKYPMPNANASASNFLTLKGRTYCGQVIVPPVPKGPNLEMVLADFVGAPVVLKIVKRWPDACEVGTSCTCCDQAVRSLRSR